MGWHAYLLLPSTLDKLCAVRRCWIIVFHSLLLLLKVTVTMMMWKDRSLWSHRWTGAWNLLRENSVQKESEKWGGKTNQNTRVYRYSCPFISSVLVLAGEGKLIKTITSLTPFRLDMHFRYPSFPRFTLRNPFLVLLLVSYVHCYETHHVRHSRSLGNASPAMHACSSNFLISAKEHKNNIRADKNEIHGIKV